MSAANRHMVCSILPGGMASARVSARRFYKVHSDPIVRVEIGMTDAVRLPVGDIVTRKIEDVGLPRNLVGGPKYV